MEILAVPATGRNLDMPGKASEVHIYKISNDRNRYDLIKTYKNPSIEIKEDGGLPLLESLMKEKSEFYNIAGNRWARNIFSE